jgi:hypothetical protein
VERKLHPIEADEDELPPAPQQARIREFFEFGRDVLGVEETVQLRYLKPDLRNDFVGLYDKTTKTCWVEPGRDATTVAFSCAHELVHASGVKSEDEANRIAHDLVRRWRPARREVDVIPERQPQFFGGF